MGQLHIAAMTYRQSGIDFWAGPLDTISGGIVDTTCQVYDRLWKINRADVESFVQNRNDPNYVLPDVILNWPAHGNIALGNSRWLAPFNDVDGDLNYNPLKGDHPAFSLSGQNNCDKDLLGDQAIWWVFNDKGNTHSESGGAAMGVEIQAMAFAYRSRNDALNDATFYRYRVINRSTTAYNQVWFAQWTDNDVGEYQDDYVGCDVARGLGYAYNGDLYDGSSPQPSAGTYGEHPPAIGIDFLSGPIAIPGDGIDNDRDLIVDEAGERIQMSHSLLFTKGPSVTGWPGTAQNKYDRMQSIWNDGTHFTYGGTGYGGMYPCDYMFPGDSDPYNWGTYGIPQNYWDEVTSNNAPGDRRQMNSVGPFTLNPGQFEVITIGVPWARDTAGDNYDAIEKLKAADDYIQLLFAGCFSVPCADQQTPEITFTVDDKLAYFTLYAGGTAWNWDFGDGQTSNQKHPSHYYMAPGDYTVCVEVTTTCGTFRDCDTVHIADQLMACGPAIFRIEGKGNGKQELEFSSETIREILDSSRSFFPMYLPMHGPVKVSYEDYDALQDGEYRIAFDSTDVNSHWKMWRVGGFDTVFSYYTIGSGNLERILMWGIGVQIAQVPSPGYGTNPDKNGYITSSITFSDPTKSWLSGISDDDTYRFTSENWIRSGTMSGTGTCVAEFLDRSMGSAFLDPNENFESVVNGTWGPYRLCAYNPTPTATSVCYNYGPAWTPSSPIVTQLNKLENLANVDVMFTSDKSKWTRCPVLETGPFDELNQNDRECFHLRAARSVDKNGRDITNGGFSDPNNPEAADYIGAYGMGWFPGYAINLETGERLNMAFGENSAYTSENGRDMLWNPTENEVTQAVGPLWGGNHYVYVFGHNGDATYTSGPLVGELKDIPMYDAGKAMHTILAYDSTSNPELKEVFSDAMWTTIPVLAPGHSLLECDVTVKLRVQKPYAKYATSTTPENRNFPLYGFRIDKENLGCNVYPHDVMVYPNPFSDECVIQFDNRNYHKTDLKLYDMQGKLVRVYEDVTSDRIVISGAGLFSGVYIWSLEVEGEEPKTGKLILR